MTAGTYASSTSTYTTITTAIKTFADGFLAINAKYTPSNGGLAEQYNKATGAPLSAVDLTWSYASALTAFAARKGISPPSWGAKGLTVPSVCVPNTGPTVQATFKVVATTQLGGELPWFLMSLDDRGVLIERSAENIFLTGNLDALKAWSPDNALALSSASYPTWSSQSIFPF